MFSSDDLIFLAPEQSAVDMAAGGFARKVWVLTVQEPGHGDSNRDFLAKVLAAVQLNLEKDTLLAEIPAQQPLNFSISLQHKHAAQVLVFGILPAQLGLRVETAAYRPFSFYGSTWLFADALSVLEPDKTKKAQLWAALRQIFQ
jgi:hypothetical protein